MNSKQVIIYTILVFMIIIPIVNAQAISIGEKAVQKSVSVIINSSDKIHVKHVIVSSSSPTQIELINGTKTNLKVTDEVGKEEQFGTIGNNDSLVIYPSPKNTVVEYDLGDVIFLKDNVWTWDFRYLETTSFIIPKEVDLIFINNKPVYLGEKNGITCHGCQMTLEYFINEPRILKNIKLENKEFPIEIRTFAEINQFNFEQSTKSFSFEVNGKNQFVTAIIPVQLLPEKYNVFMGDKKIPFHSYINNGTHVWLNIRPENSGNISIIDATINGTEKLDNLNNPLFPNLNQNIIIYILLGVIVLIGLVITVIIIRKKRPSVIFRETQNNKK